MRRTGERSRSYAARALFGAAGIAGVLGAATAPAAAQTNPQESAMLAAARWVVDRLPEGSLRLDPHRSGQGTDRATVERVARALGAGLATLEETRRCEDTLDRSTCTLACDVLLALAPPEIRGDRATVKVYAWYRSSSRRSPVEKGTWVVELRGGADGWRVVSGG